jgi:hypothetical protein
MASSSIETTKHDDSTTRTLYLVGSSEVGATWKDSAQALSTPVTVSQKLMLAPVGAKGNDKIRLKMAVTCDNNAGDGVVTGSATLDVSIPRDTGFTEAIARDMIAELASILVSADRVTLCDGMIL